MAKTIGQLQAFIDTVPDLRQVVNEVVDYLQANAPGGAAPGLTDVLTENNDAGGLAIVNLSNITSGVYTPTVIPLINLDAAAALSNFYYYRVGDVVTFFGTLMLNPTSASAPTSASISLPINSNFTVSSEASGMGMQKLVSSANVPMVIVARAGESVVDVLFRAVNTTQEEYPFSCTYLIVP